MTTEPAVPNASFSAINPNIQLAWDSTSLKALQFCARHYQMNMLEGWSASGQVNLDFGRFIASALETYQKGRLQGLSRVDALLPALRAMLVETYTPATADTPASQWGGHFEEFWRCTGSEPYKNDKGNRAKCPFTKVGVLMPMPAPDLCGHCGSPVEIDTHYVPGDKAKHRMGLVRLLVWYVLDQPEDLDEGLKPYVFADGTPAVELSVVIPLDLYAETGEQYLLTGHIDYIGQLGKDGPLTPVDNKTTTKTLGQRFFDGYLVDTQFDTYDLMTSLLLPDLPISGITVDALQITVGGAAFGRHTYFKREETREEHFQDLQYWIKQAEEYATAGYWPMNKRSCWLCEFKGVCASAPQDRPRWLAANYQRRERWNPLKPRT